METIGGEITQIRLIGVRLKIINLIIFLTLPINCYLYQTQQLPKHVLRFWKWNMFLGYFLPFIPIYQYFTLFTSIYSNWISLKQKINIAYQSRNCCILEERLSNDREIISCVVPARVYEIPNTLLIRPDCSPHFLSLCLRGKSSTTTKKTTTKKSSVKIHCLIIDQYVIEKMQ